MIRTVAFRALLAAALVIAIPGAATAQAEGPTLEGTEWYLVAYDAGGPELTPVPWDVVPTLSFRKRQATGSTGCNGFSARYELDGEQMTISPRFLNQRACPAPKGEVEAAYWAALPKVARWDDGPQLTEDRELILFDADDEQILRFSPPRRPARRSDPGPNRPGRGPAAGDRGDAGADRGARAGRLSRRRPGSTPQLLTPLGSAPLSTST